MSTRQSVLDQVRAATEGTPYVVKETPEGFDLEIDVVDARCTPVNYRFDSGEGRGIIRGVLKENGWSEQMGSEQKTGLAVAGLTVVALIVAGIVALVMALLG